MAMHRLITLSSLAILIASNWLTLQAKATPNDNAEGIPYSTHLRANSEIPADKPLILTPYIEEGNIPKARRLSLVPHSLWGIHSYSGFFTVNSSCNANLFFLFFPQNQNVNGSALTVWLQGGPGLSSLYGVFNEHGPLQLNGLNKFQRRFHDWSKISAMLYIDNPIGTGYSFAHSSECYSKNQAEIGANLLEVVKQFLVLFHEYRNSPLFIAGESYGGKHAASLAYAIHHHQLISSHENSINLNGLLLNSPFIDPINQLPHGDYLYHIGLIDESDKPIFHELEKQCRSLIKEGKTGDAMKTYSRMLIGSFFNESSLFKNITNFNYLQNYYYDKPPNSSFQMYVSYVQDPSVRSALHVGNQIFHIKNEVMLNLEEDLMKSEAHALSSLLEHYRIWIDIGQSDILVPYPSAREFIKKLEWSGANEWGNSKKKAWYVGDSLAGYAKQWGRLAEVMVRNAGHSVPADQPEWAFDLFNRFINNLSLG